MGAISIQGEIAKLSILASRKPMTSVTEFTSDVKWVGHQYLTREPRAETVASAESMRVEMIGLFFLSLLGLV